MKANCDSDNKDTNFIGHYKMGWMLNASFFEAVPVKIFFDKLAMRCGLEIQMSVGKFG